LRDIPKPLQQRLGVREVEEVTFVEQSLEAFRYRDAVRFPNGREILLQDLHSGQRVEVLSLDSTEVDVERMAAVSMPAEWPVI
jgi:hypothetical protein